MKEQPALFCLKLILLISLFTLWSCDRTKVIPSDSKGAADIVLADQLKNRGSYDSAIIFFRKSADRNLKTNQYPEWIRSISGMIDCYRSKSDLEEAMRLTEQALAIAQTKIDTTSDLYNGLIHKKASLYSDKRQFDQATQLFNRNIRIHLSETSVPDTGLALAYNGLGTVYLLQNHTAEALEQYNKALDAYRKAQNTRSPNYASTLQNIGIVHSMNGNYENAEKFFLQSLKVNQEVLLANDSKLASLYLNMGRFYQIIRNDAKALEYMNRAESFYITQNQSNSIMAGSLFLNMGGVYIYTADFEKAQSYLNKSLEIISVKSPGNLADILTIYLNMGYIAEKKGDYASAKELYLKGLSIGDKFPNSVKVLRGLASSSFKLGEDYNVNVYYKKALQKSIEMYGVEHPETALTYLRYGDFLSATGNAEATSFLLKSLELYKKAFGQVSIDVSTAYYYIGNNYYRAKNYNKAIEYFQEALIAGFPGFTSKSFSDNPDISKNNINDNLLNPLTAKATALLLLYEKDTTKTEYLTSSSSCFNLSIKMIEMLRSSYQEEESKLFILENEKNTFSNAILSQVKLYQKTRNHDALKQAFALSEKGKSAILLSHLRDKEARNIGRIPGTLLAQDANLKSEIFFYNKQIHDQKLTANPDPEKIKLWNSRIFDLSRKQEELIKSIERDYPAYYNLKYDNSVISTDEIRKRLTPDQAIVEFSLTDTILYTFAITSKSEYLVTTYIDKSFGENLEILREQLSGKGFNNYTRSDYKNFIRASNELYRILLQPLQREIKGKQLIIIPDGELGYLSFDVLLTSMPDTSKSVYKNLPYLIKECAISYAPSATTFFNELNLKSARNNGRILAFGPGYGPDNDVLNQKDNNGNTLRSILTNLSNSQEEIKNLGSYFKVKKFIGADATEASFKQKASDYRILHLAMHTIINNENPLYSKLIFFKPEGDTTEDGMLNASELVNMELNADMAVLSACNTGSGKMQKGEGIMSLSRDFFYAGVPGIIMTAWAVEDRAGIQIMENFYRYIAMGRPRHEALRLAKIDYLDNCDKLTSHPHYWASYMNVGDISPLKGFSKKPNFYLIFAIAAAILLIATTVYRIRLKKYSKDISR